MEGLRQSGFTFLNLDEDIDSGDILGPKAFPISLKDHASTPYEKIRALPSGDTAEFLPKPMNNTAQRISPGLEPGDVLAQRTAKDGEMHWHQQSMTIYNLVRALTDLYTGRHTFLIRCLPD